MLIHVTRPNFATTHNAVSRQNLRPGHRVARPAVVECVMSSLGFRGDSVQPVISWTATGLSYDGYNS